MRTEVNRKNPRNSRYARLSGENPCPLGGRLGNRLALQIGRRVVHGADEDIAPGPPARGRRERRGAVLEPDVVEDQQVTGVQLLPENRIAVSRAVGPVLVLVVQVRFRAVAFPVQDVNHNEFLVVPVRFSDHVGVRPEQVDPERAFLLPPVFWHQAEKRLYEFPELPVVKQLDALVDALSLNPGTVPDGDRRSIRSAEDR